MCLLDHSAGARLHRAKIIAVGFGAAFLCTTLRLVSTILPFLSNADSVVVSSHSYPRISSNNERLESTTNWESYHSWYSSSAYLIIALNSTSPLVHCGFRPGFFFVSFWFGVGITNGFCKDSEFYFSV